MSRAADLESQLLAILKARHEGAQTDLRRYLELLFELEDCVEDELADELVKQFSKQDDGLWRDLCWNRKKKNQEKLAAIIAKRPNAYKPWDSEQEKQLIELHNSGKTIREIAEIMQRQKGGIWARMKKLDLNISSIEP